MIYIIRHGQTELNTRNVLQGRSDHPLNETGLRQAKEAAERLKGVSFAAVYSSPLIRAIRTAEIIAPALEPVIDMEPLDSVVRRGGAFMEDRCRTRENILISTHAIAMKGILEYLTPDSGGSYWSKNIGNCAVYTAEYLPDGSWTVPVEMQ